MGRSYLWLVRVWNYFDLSGKYVQYGFWTEMYDQEKTFTNKLNALNYAMTFRKPNWKAEVIKWFGEDTHST